VKKYSQGGLAGAVRVKKRILYVCSQFWAEQTAASKTRPFKAKDRN